MNQVPLYFSLLKTWEEAEDDGDGYVLQFWRHNRHTISYVIALAGKLLSIPATSVTAERLFLGGSPDTDYGSDVEEKWPQSTQSR
ncbi:hypothetical protein QYM36_009302 [Artemia franciscana]|uniref:HAT C-terminal dimerisation domain-containing protein n=1 Tax=Artemia franciscana TaxID=6661 RepID=A0AA88HZ51_ARTSF|nr:hypothetical protein QYM36_009302 [Artemia franciscana]